MLVNPLVLLYFVVVLLLFVAVPPPGPGSAVGPAGHRWAPGLTWGLSYGIWNFSMKTLFIYYLIFLRQELKHRWILISFIYLGLIKVCLELSILVFCRSLKVFWECYQSILISKHSNSYILSAFIKCSACIFPKKTFWELQSRRVIQNTSSCFHHHYTWSWLSCPCLTQWRRSQQERWQGWQPIRC